MFRKITVFLERFQKILKGLILCLCMVLYCVRVKLVGLQCIFHLTLAVNFSSLPSLDVQNVFHNYKKVSLLFKLLKFVCVFADYLHSRVQPWFDVMDSWSLKRIWKALMNLRNS